MKSFIWIGIVTIALIGLIIWGVSGSSQPGSDFDPGVVYPTDRIKGNASSTVVITEYSDFQCSACRNYYPLLRELTTEYGDKIVFVFRYFPLTSIHANAKPAAWAAEAAGKQGKFWEMHDLLFEKQSEWATTANIGPLFDSYASLLGLSLDKFKADFSSKEVRDIVNAQERNALKLGLPGTPSFFVNGVQIQNPTSLEAFRAIINKAIESKR